MNAEKAINYIQNMDLSVFKDRDEACEAVDFITKLLQRQLNGWIPVSDGLPKNSNSLGQNFIDVNATILAPSGLRRTVPLTLELKYGKPTWCYMGMACNWNVIAWQPLPPKYEEVSE